VFDDKPSLSAKPGQFAMIWVPGVGEFPMSLCTVHDGDKSSIVVKAMGEGSRRMYECKARELIGVRGPYGNGFQIPKGADKILLVGGGTGMAPIMELAEKASKTKGPQAMMVIGARTKVDLPFLLKSKSILGASNVFPATDDGSLGAKGFAHEEVERLVEKFRFDRIYSCGPEAMMKEVYRIATERSIPVQLSLERIMKCGIAICGSCCIQDVVLCRDGPVLDEKTLPKILKEFGKFERDKTGTLVPKK
jgi:dihydroorotate dehydrogenase electron transfer subunit